MRSENLRETMRERAGDAPPGGGLLDAVLARSRHRRQQRRLMVAGSAAAVIAVALTAPAVVRAVGDGPGGSAPPPAARQTDPATVEPTPEPTGATTLVPAPDFALPDFPFTPTWIPPDLGDPTYGFVDYNGDAEINADDVFADERMMLYHHADDGLAVTWVEVSDQDPAPILDKLEVMSRDVDEDEPGAAPEPLTRQATTVHGREAVLLSSSEQGIVAWRHEPGRWVTVFGRSADEVLQYAASLPDEPLASQTPFTFDLLPDGARLTQTQPSQMLFEPSEAATLGGTGLDAVTVELFRSQESAAASCPYSADPGSAPQGDPTECQPTREPVQVHDRAGELVGDHTLDVLLPDGRVLQVTAAGGLSLSRDELLRFAAGIEVTEHAVPAR